MLKRTTYLILMTYCLMAKTHAEIFDFEKEKNDTIQTQSNANQQEEWNDELLIPCTRGLILVGAACDLQKHFHGDFEGLQVFDLSVCEKDIYSLQAILEPLFLNQPLTKSRLSQIKQAIITFYKDRNFPIVDVRLPEQEVTNGILQLVIVQSKLGEVRCCGNNWFSSKYLCGGIRLSEGSLIDTSILASDVAWLNRNPFSHTDIIFTPGQKPGTTDIELQTVDQRPYRIFGGWDDHGTEPIGTNRRFVGFTAGNLWDQGHILSYQYTTSLNFKNLQAHAGQYIVPLNCHHTLNLFGGYARVHDHIYGHHKPGHHPKKNPDRFRHKGQSYQASARYRMMYELTQKSLQEVYFGADYKNTNNNLLYSDSPAFSSKVALFQFVLGYHHELESSTRDTQFDVEFYCSPGQWLGDQSEKDYDRLRPGANNTYAYLLSSLENTLYFPNDFRFYTSFQAQVASTALLPSEQFGLGGYDTVRGYEEREINGDNAFLANFELHFPHYSFFKNQSWFKSNCVQDKLYFLLFFDYGIALNNKGIKDKGKGKGHGSEKSEYLAGVGPGLRYVANPYFSLNLDWGIQLHHLGKEKKGFKSRVHFSAIASY
jgi:hemolysin activation/secretion protein